MDGYLHFIALLSINLADLQLHSVAYDEVSLDFGDFGDFGGLPSKKSFFGKKRSSSRCVCCFYGDCKIYKLFA